MVLRNLLNYLLYQRMVKTSTIDVVDDKIAARDALLIERNRLKKEIEHNKINHQNVSSPAFLSKDQTINRSLFLDTSKDKREWGLVPKNEGTS